MGALPGAATAAGEGDVSVRKAGPEATRRAVERVRGSTEYETLLERVGDVGDSVSPTEPKVLQRTADETEFVVSVRLNGELRQESRRLQNNDLVFVVDSEYDLVAAGGTAIVRDAETGERTVTAFEATDGGISTESATAEAGTPVAARSDEVRAAGACDSCKAAYDELCGGIGCNWGIGTICYIIGGVIGGVFCGGLVGDLCDFIDNNSCENGLNEVVCQILGYCSTDPGDEPCEEFPGGTDSPYCDA